MHIASKETKSIQDSEADTHIIGATRYAALSAASSRNLVSAISRRPIPSKRTKPPAYLFSHTTMSKSISDKIKPDCAKINPAPPACLPLNLSAPNPTVLPVKPEMRPGNRLSAAGEALSTTTQQNTQAVFEPFHQKILNNCFWTGKRRPAPTVSNSVNRLLASRVERAARFAVSRHRCSVRNCASSSPMIASYRPGRDPRAKRKSAGRPRRPIRTTLQPPDRLRADQSILYGAKTSSTGVAARWLT